MGGLRRLSTIALVVLLTCSLVIPFPVSSASPLGTAHGIKPAKLSIDGGKSWLPLSGRDLPVLEGTELRSGSGGAMLDLADGSRVDVLPFSSLRFRETSQATEIALNYGRLTFRFPPDSRVQIVTATARLEPTRSGAMVGEVFVGAGGLVGLKMSQGALYVRSLAEPRTSLLASLEPVFLPKRPAGPGSFFTSDVPEPVPARARSVFTPSGESIGYLVPDGRLVIHPGFSSDLTRPFPPKLVQVVMARIPEDQRSDEAMPLFDVNGGYVGYLAGPVFFAQATQPATPAAPAAPAATSGKGLSTGAIAAIGAGSVAAVGVGIAAGVGAFQGSDKRKCPPPQASPPQPPPGCP